MSLFLVDDNAPQWNCEMPDTRFCPDCRGKGQYAGLDITCRRCNGSGMWRPEREPVTTPRPLRATDDPDWLNPEKGGNRGADDYWEER